MPSSTLTPDNLPAGRDRRLGRGHGTDALGPSDSSDTGSDIAGAHGNLDGDSDAEGSGERAAAGRDTPATDGRDIGVDHLIEEGGFDAGALDAGELDAEDLEEGDRARPDLADNPRNAARTSSRDRR